jgi:uncharacterized protein YbjQ (UPF0145 family)
MITITKVVSRNFIIDLVAKWQNIFGANISPYENMIQKGIIQIQEELKLKNIELKWYRFEMNQLTNGAMAIMLYGDEK